MRVLRIIAYILYFLMWSIALILGGFLFTDKWYIIGVMVGSLWGSFTLFITILVFLTLAIVYRLKKEKDSAILKAMRICALPFIPALLLLAVFFYPNTLEEEEQTIELTYIRWACDCPNWATEKDYKKYWDSPDDSLADRCVYIEPADPSLELPESAENARAVRFTGKFYKRKGFPKGHFSIEQPDKARVFRYTKYKVLKRRTK